MIDDRWYEGPTPEEYNFGFDIRIENEDMKGNPILVTKRNIPKLVSSLNEKGIEIVKSLSALRIIKRGNETMATFKYKHLQGNVVASCYLDLGFGIFLSLINNFQSKNNWLYGPHINATLGYELNHSSMGKVKLSKIPDYLRESFSGLEKPVLKSLDEVFHGEISESFKNQVEFHAQKSLIYTDCKMLDTCLDLYE